MRLCETSFHGGSLLAGFRPGLVTTRLYTSSEEPPLSNFNSYWDIPRVQSSPVMKVKSSSPVMPSALGG